MNPASFRTTIDAAVAKVIALPSMQTHGRAHRITQRRRSLKLRGAVCAASVEAIARFDAGAQNLHVTSRRIEELVGEAQPKHRKRFGFVTGVPSQGRHCWLNLATRREEDEPTHAVFLSGNGPLVAVLREALTRDEVERRKKQVRRCAKGKSVESVKAFIQTFTHFRDDALIDVGPPVEHRSGSLMKRSALGISSRLQVLCCAKNGAPASLIRAGVSDFVHGQTQRLGCHRLPCRRWPRNQHGRSWHDAGSMQ